MKSLPQMLLGAGFLLLSLASCKKERESPVLDSTLPQVRVSGLVDVVIQRTPFRIKRILTQVSFLVKQASGNKQNVTLGFENLPAGLTDSFKLKRGTPDFGDTVSFLDLGVAAGEYQPALLLKPDTGATQRYPIRLKVLGDTVCSAYFLNKTWIAMNNCINGSSSPVYSIQVSRINGTDSLVINNFDNKGNKIKVLLKCKYSDVLIPDQTLDGKRLSGYGRITSMQSLTATEYSSPYPNALWLQISENAPSAPCFYTFMVQ